MFFGGAYFSIVCWQYMEKKISLYYFTIVEQINLAVMITKVKV